MTTPEERRRNLTWGREMLLELSQDPELRPDWRDAAARLLGAYPPPERVEGCDPANLRELQDEHSRMLTSIRSLFQFIKADPSCSEQRRYTLLIILRHFY